MIKFVCPWKIRGVAVLGLCLSLYALYVEEQKKNDPDYEALCDLGYWNISCSSAFASQYGHLILGLPNALLGVVFYIGVLVYTVASFIPFRHHLFFLGVLSSCGFSVYLMWCLISLGDLCIVCTATYVLNFGLLYLSYRQVRAAATEGAKLKKLD